MDVATKQYVVETVQQETNINEDTLNELCKIGKESGDWMWYSVIHMDHVKHISIYLHLDSKQIKISAAVIYKT